MASRPVVFMACGSFNPPTPMHLRMFEIAKDHYNSMGVPVLGGIISPVHDSYAKKELIPSKHRFPMLQMAVKSSNWIKVSDWEINKEEWTKTRYSLQYHQNYINAYMQAASNGTIEGGPPSWMPYDVVNLSRNNTGRDEIDGVIMNSPINNGNEGEGNLPKVQVKLLCGADLLESFATPGLWSTEDLQSILEDHGIVVITRSGCNPEKFIYDSDVLTHYKRNITTITNWVPNEVSSTMIRRLVRRGESIKYLIEDSIISYIKMHHLYGSVDQTIKYLTCEPLQPCITTPSPNDIIMKSPSEFRMQRDNVPFKPRGSTISSKIMNYLIGVDEVDKNEVYTSSNQTSTSHFKEKRSRLTNKVSASMDLPPRSFCGESNDQGSTDSLESMHILPRKSVKVITDVSGVHKIVNNKKKVCGNNLDITDDVFVFINCKLIGADLDTLKTGSFKKDPKLYIDIDKLKIEDESNSIHCDTPKSPRSYDEVVKFIFSEHGIQVISDRETIV